MHKNTSRSVGMQSGMEKVFLPPRESANDTPFLQLVAEGELDPEYKTFSDCTDLQRRDEVIPPYGCVLENLCLSRERPGEGRR